MALCHRFHPWETLTLAAGQILHGSVTGCTGNTRASVREGRWLEGKQADRTGRPECFCGEQMAVTLHCGWQHFYFDGASQGQFPACSRRGNCPINGKMNWKFILCIFFYQSTLQKHFNFFLIYFKFADFSIQTFCVKCRSFNYCRVSPSKISW